MARAKRRPKKRKEGSSKNESDEQHDVPDPDSEEFFYDDVDEFHKNREKILLQKSEISSEEELDEEEKIEEVLGLDIDSDDDDDYYYAKNDVSENEDDEKHQSSDESDKEKGIPSEKAWGRKKKIYYDVDAPNEKDIESEEEELLDKEEEEEAIAMQQRMAAMMDDNDFDVEEFELTAAESPDKKDKENEAKQEKIMKDLSKLSKEEKLKLLAKDSPELFELVKDFEEKLADVIDCLQPLVTMARSGMITNKQGVEYLETKHELTMNYLVNISFYLLLKAHQTSVKNHPVIERLVQYRELLEKLKPFDSKLQGDMEHFLKIYKTGKDNIAKFVSEDKNKEKPFLDKKETNDKTTKKVKFLKSTELSISQPREILPHVPISSKKRKSPENMDPMLYYEAVKEMKRKKKEERQNTHLLTQEAAVENEDDMDIDGKRSITYQISKNKGLTPKRKKELRNPRIKHRKKFGKAKIKHKSQILPITKELTRYGGESTGIKTHLTRSIKIK